MSFTRYGDELLDELAAAEPAVLGIHLAANLYSTKYLTDGVVPVRFLRGRGATKRLLDRAIALGLFAQHDREHVSVVDVWRFGPTQDEKRRKREQWAEQKRRQRAKHGQMSMPDMGVDMSTMSTPESAPESAGMSPPRASAHAGAPRTTAPPNHHEESSSAQRPVAGAREATEPVFSDRVEEACEVLRRSPVLDVDTVGVAAVAERFPDADLRAAALTAVEWASAPGWRKRNGAGVLGDVLERAARRREELRATIAQREGPPPAAELCPLGVAGDEHPGLAELTEQLARELRERVAGDTFSIWLQQLHVHALEAGVLTIAAVDDARRQWIAGRFTRQLRSAAQQLDQVTDFRLVTCQPVHAGAAT